MALLKLWFRRPETLWNWSSSSFFQTITRWEREIRLSNTY